MTSLAPPPPSHPLKGRELLLGHPAVTEWAGAGMTTGHRVEDVVSELWEISLRSGMSLAWLDVTHASDKDEDCHHHHV
jgi:hypothetical protein